MNARTACPDHGPIHGRRCKGCARVIAEARDRRLVRRLRIGSRNADRVGDFRGALKMRATAGRIARRWGWSS